MKMNLIAQLVKVTFERCHEDTCITNTPCPLASCFSFERTDSSVVTVQIVVEFEFGLEKLWKIWYNH